MLHECNIILNTNGNWYSNLEGTDYQGIWSETPSGWVITQEKYVSPNFTNSWYEKFFYNVNKEFTCDGTGHEMLFSTHNDAIRYALKNNLRNVSFEFKIC